MRAFIRLMLMFSACGLAACGAAPPEHSGSADEVLDDLVALERSALDRWMTLNPDGYLGLFAPDVTYFDPTTERRVAGLTDMQARLTPMKTMNAPFTDPRYELIDPKVQRDGDVALLTFNVISYGKPAGGVERELARWNSTEVDSRASGAWKIIHSHWSYVMGQRKPAGP